MSPAESLAAVLEARRRNPGDVVYGIGLAHERFAPDELLRQAAAADDAGFDLIACSDHLAPWWEDGDPAPANSGNAWVWLGAASQVTSRASIGTAVTAVIHRYNPVIVAQQIATLEILAPGRTFLGVGSGEALNEVPAGMDPFPGIEEQQERMEEQVTIIRRLLDGETVTFDGKHFKTREAKLWSLPERRPPIYMSAFGEHAARMAGRIADGVWTLADPDQAPSVIAAYRDSCDSAGREPGEIVLQALFSWAEDDATALESAREWKATLPPEHYTDAIWKPGEIQANGRAIDDEEFKGGAAISSDPQEHLRAVERIRDMGATAVVMMNTSGADPEGAVRMYGEQVLPALRD